MVIIILGMMCGIFPLVLKGLLNSYTKLNQLGYYSTVVVTPITEEVFKFLFLLLLFYISKVTSKDFYINVGIVQGLTFGLLEWVYGYLTVMWILRVLAVLLHIVLCRYDALAVYEITVNSNKRGLVYLLMAILVHASWNLWSLILAARFEIFRMQ